MKRLLVSLLTMAACVSAVWAGFPSAIISSPDTIPPPGWKWHITPGFSPPIEKLIVYPPGSWVGKNRDYAIRKQMETWGPRRTMPVLERMYNDSFWREYRLQVLSLIHRGRPADKMPFYHEAIAALSGSPLTESEQKLLASLLAGILDEDPAAMAREVDKLLANPVDAENLLPFLKWYVYEEPSTPYVAALRTITESESDPGLKRSLEDFLQSFDAKQRAKEPMEKVLATEANVPVPYAVPNPHGDKAVAAEAQRNLMELSRELANSGMNWAERAMPLVRTIADEFGDDAVPLFEQWAVDSTLSRGVRATACVGLGYLGSEKSVEAFKRLREGARKKAWAPASSASYTHAQRMTETCYLIEYVIALDAMPTNLPAAADTCSWVRVEQGYLTGRFGNRRGDEFSFRRTGNEWLPTELEPTYY